MSRSAHKMNMVLKASTAYAIIALSMAACSPSLAEIDCAENPDSVVCSPGNNSLPSPPRLYVDPPFGLGFNCVLIECNETRTLSIQNRGGGIVAIAVAEIWGDTNDFSLLLINDTIETSGPLTNPSPHLPLTLATGESIDVAITYEPSDGNEDISSLHIEWFDGKNPYDEAVVHDVDIPITARLVSRAEAEVRTDRINFGYVAMGSSDTQFIEIFNVTDSDAVLSVTEVVFSEETPDVFEVNPGWTTHANPNTAVRVPINFEPDQEQAFFGTLRVRLNNTATIYEIPVMGTAIATAAPVLESPNPPSLDFGSVFYNQRATRSIAVRNDGGSPVTLEPIVTHGFDVGFGVATDPILLDTLETIRVNVDLLPNQGGDLLGEMEIQATDIEWAPLLLELVAVASAPIISLDQWDIAIPPLVQDWTSAPIAVTIDNTGTGQLIIYSMDFDVGSSDQIQLSTELDFPLVIDDDAPPLALTFVAHGSQLGTASATVNIRTNSIDGEIAQIHLFTEILSCEAGCPTANGTPNCQSGSCEIESCSPGWHDTDDNTETGCECQEDRGGNDIGPVCSSGSDLGYVGDNCSSHPSQLTVTGTLHSSTDIDLYFVRSEDIGCISDLFGDSAISKVELVEAPPGLALCTVFSEMDTGCGGYTNYFDPSMCGNPSYTYPGGWGGEDSREMTTWLMWHPDAFPSCGTYTIRFRGAN